MSSNRNKARVDVLIEEHGWAITGLSGNNLSVSYRNEIELVLDITSFQPHQANSTIDLWYIAHNRDVDPEPQTPEKEFLLQCIRDNVRAVPQSRTKLSHLLDMVRMAWDTSNRISSQISKVNISFPTTASKTSDSSIAMTSSILLTPLESRVEVVLTLQDMSGPNGMDVAVSHEARVVYGESFNIENMGKFLATRIGTSVKDGAESWSDIFVELKNKLIARGKK